MRRGLLNGSRWLCAGESMDKNIWGLFTPMLKASSTASGIECVSEIVESARSGDIDMTREFNLYGYAYAVSNGKRLKMNQRARKETFIDFSSSNKDDVQATGYEGGEKIDVISYRSAMAEAKSEFDSLFDNEELRFAIESIKACNEDFIVDYSVDLIALIKNACKCIPQAVIKLKEVCEEMSCVAEQVKIILTSGVSIDTCFAD